MYSQGRGKLVEARAANGIPNHPSQGNVFSLTKDHGGKELKNKINVEVFFDLHERMQAKLLHDPKGIFKVQKFLKMRKIDDLLGAHLMSPEVEVDLFENKFLVFAVKALIIGASRHLIKFAFR
jgi:hypothetical protein